ncbi:MAG: peptide-binding protein [Deltaproteobacteria bacterium]|nr:peptide-binding protein [Deltaproteobacteria bacterium]
MGARGLIVFFSLSLSLSLYLSGCGERQRAETPAPNPKPGAVGLEPAHGDTVVEGSIGEATNLIPMLASDSASHNIAGLIINGLVKYDKDVRLVGDLAESWEVSQGGLQITFKLHRNVRWHDRHPFTAHDVLFGFQTIINPATPTAYAEDFRQVKKAEVIDDYTFRVTYEKPFAPALSSWGNLVVLPKHLLEGKDVTKSDLARRPIGTGPYRFKEWISRDRVILEANPDYFEGRPFIDRYVIRVIPDLATMFLELKAGGLDLMGLTPIQYKRQTDDPFFRDNFSKYRYLANAYTYLGYNLLEPKFQDKRVRQALTYAIDKDEIIKVVLLGLGAPATGPYKPGLWFYNPNVKNYPHDPAKALALLKEAGWADRDSDGILDKDGQPFEFTVITNEGNALRHRTAVIIQERLKKIGIRIKIRVIEWSAFINEFIDKKDFEATILGWTTGFEPDQYDIWHSSKTGKKELNFISYKNPEVDELLEAGRRTFEQEKRKAIYGRFQEILAEEQPYAFLYVPEALPIVHARIHGIEPSPLGISYNFHRWYVPKESQKYGRVALLP